MAAESYWINSSVFQNLARQAGIVKQAALMRVTGKAKRTIQKVLSGREPVDEETCIACAKAVGLHGDYTSFVYADPPAHISDNDPNDVDDGPGGHPDPNGGKKRQDVKVLVEDPDIRKRLASGKNMPTFAEAMLDSCVVTTISDKHKDHPLLPGTDYNHFVQPSIIVVLQRNGDSVVLKYERLEDAALPYNVHTKGMSLLFAADPKHYTLRESPLDIWIRKLEHSKTNALNALLAGPRPVLLEMLQHKIDLLREPTTIEPFGVITRDQCEGDTPRVYTQFVFRVAVNVAGQHFHEFAAHFRTPSTVKLRIIPDDEVDPMVMFVSGPGKPNLMDQLAWAALRSKEATVVEGNAWFSRNFSVV